MNMKTWLKIAIPGIIAIVGILFGGYQYYVDTASFDKLTKAREYLDKGKDVLLKNGPVNDNEVELSYNYARRGIEMLYELKNQKSIPVCPEKIRKQSITELINFYKLYPKRETIQDSLNNLIDELKKY